MTRKIMHVVFVWLFVCSVATAGVCTNNPYGDGLAIIKDRGHGTRALSIGYGWDYGVVAIGNKYGILTPPLIRMPDIKANLVVGPSLEPQAPTHFADRGALWVTSEGVLYIQTAVNGRNYEGNKWQKVGAQ